MRLGGRGVVSRCDHDKRLEHRRFLLVAELELLRIAKLDHFAVGVMWDVMCDAT